MIIYKATNKINGKIYIGKTSRPLDKRVYDHCYRGSGTPIQKAIKKYGIQAFEWSIIDTAICKEILNEKEEYWISYLNSKAPNGYNLTDGGDGQSKGFRHSEESKKKISEAGKGHTVTKEAREKLSNFLTGKKLAEETCKKISIANKGKLKGKPKSEDHKRKLSASLKGRVSPMKGRHLSEDSKSKISKSLEGHFVTEETKNKMRRRSYTEETKRKMSESHKKIIRNRNNRGQFI